MHRVLDRATPMLKAVRTEKATVVLEPDCLLTRSSETNATLRLKIAFKI